MERCHFESMLKNVETATLYVMITQVAVHIDLMIGHVDITNISSRPTGMSIKTISP